MATVRFGGDPESYMDPPQMTQTDKAGAPGIIASVLDLLGVNKQVAKEPKADVEPAATPATTQSIPPPVSQLPVLNEANQAFQPMIPMASDWGQRYLDSLKPMKLIDPNTAM